MIAWIHARQNNGKIELRIEDLHMERVKPGALEQIFDDLHWMGLSWDEGPQSIEECSNGQHTHVQSQQKERYRQALDHIIAAQRAYPCTCSRKEVLMTQSAPHHHELKYMGTCRNRWSNMEEAKQHSPQVHSWRFKANDHETSFIDGLHGPQNSRVCEWSGDFIIAKDHDHISYQLAVVEDDHLHGITHVIRGDDLLMSTHRQIQLYEALGYSPPHFIHLPLLIGEDGQRLAKRHGDWKISTLRAQGYLPEDIIGLIAWTLDLQPKPLAMTLHDITVAFDLSQLSRKPFQLSDKTALSYGISHH